MQRSPSINAPILEGRTPDPDLAESVREYWWSDWSKPEDLDWYFIPNFPVDAYTTEADYAENWNNFNLENSERTDMCGLEPGVQYYDSYWGWWNHATVNDCPILVFEEDGIYTWDGWHRMIIAALARIHVVPVIYGVPKGVME